MDKLALSESKQIYNPLNIDDGTNDGSFIPTFKFWVDGPIGFTLALIGVIVNLVAIVILAKQRVQRTFHLLMIFLSCWDFGYLILSILCFALPLISEYYRDIISIHLIPYVIPLAQVCLSGSCFSTIALTVERYIAVCFPFFRLRHNIKARFYIVPILLFAPLYNVPRFFEFQTIKSISFACLDDQLYALKANSNMVSRNVQEGYGNASHAFTTDAATEHLERNLKTNSVNKREIHKVGSFQEIKSENDILLRGQIEERQPILLVPSINTNQGIKTKRSNDRHIDEITKQMIKHITENQISNLNLMHEEDLLFNNSLNELDQKCSHWHKVTGLSLDVTSLRRNLLYIQIYVNYVNLVVNLFIPTIVLGWLNILVYRALKKSTEMGNQLRRSGRGEEAMRKRDIRLTRIAIVIVGVFIACHLPRFIPNIVEMVTTMPQWFAILISVNNLLQIINCTVNYLVYFGHCWKQKRSEENERHPGTICGLSAETGFEMQTKVHVNGVLKQPFIKKPTGDYARESVTAVEESTCLNPKATHEMEGDLCSKNLEDHTNTT